MNWLLITANWFLITAIVMGVLLVMDVIFLLRSQSEKKRLKYRIDDLLDCNLHASSRIQSLRKEILELRGKVRDQETMCDMWQSIAYDAFINMKQSSAEIQNKALRIDSFVKSVPGGWGQQPQRQSVIEDSCDGR